MVVQCGQVIDVHNSIVCCVFFPPKKANNRFSYLSSHDHGGASPDAQDGDVRLGRDEVQDLSDGLLVRVVTEHYALQRVPRHLCADPIDDTLGVCLIHGDHFYFGRIRDVEEILFLKSNPQGYFTRVAHQDDSNAE